MLVQRNIAASLSCLAALLLVLPGTAPAHASGLDITFGDGGRIATAVDEAVPNWSKSGPGPAARPAAYGLHLAAAPDGSLVVAQDNMLLRYLPDGQLDSKFGVDGKLVISTVEALPFGLADIAVTDEGNLLGMPLTAGFMGKILVFGSVVDPTVGRFVSAYSPREFSPSFVAVLRLDSTGALDPTFGKGNGVFLESLGLSPTRGIPGDIPLVDAESADIDSRGRAVIAVGKAGFEPGSYRATPGYVGDALIRLTPSGTLDPTFGGGDGIVEGILQGDFCISTLDEPIVGVSTGLSRLHADGALNRAFGQDGVAQGKGGFALACARSHIFTLQGPSTYSPTREDPSLWSVVSRSADDGHLNQSFNRRAVIRLKGKYSSLTSIAIDRRGRVLLAGVLELPTGRKQGRSTYFTVIRLRPSGRLDRSFGHDGWTRTSFGRDVSIESSVEVTADAIGRPVVVGGAYASWLQPSGVVLVRYLSGR